LEVNQTEQEQIEVLQKWWSENGWAIISGLILGLAAIFIWRGWQAYQQTTAEEASDLYTNMIIEVRDHKNDKAREYADRLINDYSRTTYADFATLMLAKMDVEDAKPDEAVKRLHQVLDHAHQDSLKHLARLRLVRILLDQNKIDDAWSTLKVDDEGAFASSYSELRGDIYAHQGKFEDARMAYHVALGKQGPETNDTSFLQMKIDNLGQQNPE
jgi:predicted negative regulator of RcsB-dependent stress response